MKKLRLETPKASLYPVPVVLISCLCGGRENIMTAAWTGIMSSDPPTIYVSIKPERYTYSFLSESKRFCLNIPSAGMLNKVDFCGNTSGKHLDKASKCGFEYISLVEGFPRAISECKHHLFCEVVQSLELGSHTAFVSIIKHEFVDEDCYLGKHQFDYNLIQPIAYCKKGYYFLSEKAGSYGNNMKMTDRPI